jgi:hypothetical protein
MAYIFQKLVKDAKTAGINPQNVADAREWFRSTASRVKSVDTEKMFETAKPFSKIQSLSVNSIGKMYSFYYDPKTKEKLPYYDTFPLVFPFDFKGDRFYGLNLHYLPPTYRAVLMNKLYENISDDKYTNKTKILKLNFETIKQMSYAVPCVKSYLFSHVRSDFLNINPKEWDMALMLPTQRFEKKSAQEVWRDSLKKAR